MTHHIKRARGFANLMDNHFKFFGISFGLDNFIGLVPGLGDVITFTLGFYLLWIAWQMRLPTHKMLEMVKNIVVDTLLGSIPLVGDLVDLFYKANLKNLAILEAHDLGEVIEGEVIQRL